LKILPPSKRKAISPVLATVILIAITLIAAIAIAGFVFGLFGTFTSTARAQASVTNCSWNAANEVCTLILVNSGNANTATTGSCSLSYKGTTNSGESSGVNPPVAPVAQAVNSGATVTVYCMGLTGAAAGAGTQITGSVILSNGANTLFSATAFS